MNANESMRVAVFGGTFDPPHYGHIHVITALLNSDLVDEIWLVPTGEDHKDRAVSAADRKAMIECVVECEYGPRYRVNPVKVNCCQLDGSLGDSSTWNLLNHLQNQYPSYEFKFVTGVDLIDQLSSWKKAEDLIHKFRFIAVERLGCITPSCIPPYVELLRTGSNVSFGISSSQLRESLYSGKCVVGLIPSCVLAYIEKQELYRQKRELN